MRFAGLIAMTAVIAYAIAIVPRFAWTFLFIAMLPAALYARAVISPDAGALAYTMVVTALCLRAAYRMDAGKLWWQSLWMTLCALTKPPQLAFILLAAIARPPAQLPSHGRALALIVLPALILSVLWVTMGSVDIAAWRYYEGAGIPKEQFDPVWKLRYMLAHPWHFPTQMWPNIRDADWLWWQLIGILGWLDTGLRDWVYPVLSIALVAVSLIRLDLDLRIRLWIALVAGLIVFGYALALYLIFYLAWTPIGASHVEGVQGRYFIMALPVAALFLAALVNRGPGLGRDRCLGGGGRSPVGRGGSGSDPARRLAAGLGTPRMLQPSIRTLPCPACGALTPHRYLYAKNGCDILRCAQCGLGRADATHFDPAAYYTDDYFSGGHADGYADYRGAEPVLRREFARTVDFIRRHRAGGKLLDIGCAYGFFLQEAR